MADQRRGKSAGNGRGWRARLAALGLLLTLAVLACSGDPRGPDPFQPGGEPTGGSGGGSSAALVGTWRNVVVVQVPGDLQTWTTTWRFDSDGTCHRTIETESLAEGFPRDTARACEYDVADDEVTIAFVDGDASTFEFSFAAFSPDRLVLDGSEYERLA